MKIPKSEAKNYEVKLGVGRSGIGVLEVQLWWLRIQANTVECLGDGKFILRFFDVKKCNFNWDCYKTKNQCKTWEAKK